MKHIYLLLVWVAAIPGWTQTSIDQLIIPEAGDSVELFIDATPGSVEITAPGGEQSWIWALNPGVEQTVRFDTNDREDLFPFANMTSRVGVLTNYYDFNSDEWLLTGQIGQDPFGLGLTVQTIYQPPFKEYTAPKMYEDLVTQDFDVYTGIPLTFIPDSLLELLPIVPDSMRARIVTQVENNVDAWGILHINEAEKDVLRVRQEQRIGIRIEAKISILPWADVTDLLINYFDFLPFDISLNDTLVRYQFLSPGLELPLADVAIDSLGGVTSVTYQQLPVSIIRHPEMPLSLLLYPNPASDRLTVDLTDLVGVEEIRLYDMTGRLAGVHGQISRATEDLSLDGYQTGIFVVTAWNSAGHLIAMEKLTISR